MTNIETNIKLCAYYFASESFNRGDSIIDSFIPLVEAIIRVRPEKTSFSFLDLKNKINETYDVKMPTVTLESLLRRMESKGIVTLDKHKRVTKSLIDDDYWNKKDEIESNIENLFFEFRDRLSYKDISITLEETKNIICNYIFCYSYELADFICGATDIPIKHENGVKIPYLEELSDFFVKEKNCNSIHYNSFVKLYEGAIQSSLLNFAPKKIADMNIQKFTITHVILDTNFLMRVLNMQTEIECQAANETLQALKDLNVKLIVLEQTIKEICTSITSFLQESQGYTFYTKQYMSKQRIRSTGLFDAVNRNAITRTRLLELSRYSKLKENLDEKNFEVVEDEIFDIKEKDSHNLINFKNKANYTEPLAKHDISLILYCRKNRNKRADSLETAKWWVLTNDLKLTYWNQNNKKRLLQECITEAQISNLLWLSKQKEYNNGLANTMVTLSNNYLLTPGEIGSFAIKMHKLAGKLQNDENKLNQLAIVYTSNCITENDIREVNAKELDLIKLVDEKNQQINKETEQKHKKREEINAEIKELYSKITDIESELSKLDTKKNNIENKILKLKSKRDNYKIIQNKKVTIEKGSGRILGLIYFLFFVIYCGLLIFVNNLKDINETILGLIGAGVFFIITIFITGEPLSPKKSFTYLKNRLIEKRVKNYARKKLISYEGLENSKNITGELKSETSNRIDIVQRQQDLKKAKTKLTRKREELISKLC